MKRETTTCVAASGTRLGHDGRHHGDISIFVIHRSSFFRRSVPASAKERVSVNDDASVNASVTMTYRIVVARLVAAGFGVGQSHTCIVRYAIPQNSAQRSTLVHSQWSM